MFSVYTARGSIELAPSTASARCVTRGCRKMGGGLLVMTVHMEGADDRLFTICGDHMAIAVAAAVTHPDTVLELANDGD